MNVVPALRWCSPVCRGCCRTLSLSKSERACIWLLTYIGGWTRNHFPSAHAHQCAEREREMERDHELILLVNYWVAVSLYKHLLRGGFFHLWGFEKKGDKRTNCKQYAEDIQAHQSHDLQQKKSHFSQEYTNTFVLNYKINIWFKKKKN